MAITPKAYSDDSNKYYQFNSNGDYLKVENYIWPSF